MRGYDIPVEAYEPVEEMTLVGCSTCRRTWQEMVLHTFPIRINGPWYRYNACDSCYDAEAGKYKPLTKTVSGED